MALTIWTFVNKLMSLLFNMLSTFVIAFLPRNKCPLISRLQSLSAVILEHHQSDSSVAQSCPTLWEPAVRQASLSITNSWGLLKLMSTTSVLPSQYLILCHPLLLSPSVFPSIRVFSNELVLCIRWPKYCSFSFRIGPSNENSGMISFRIDWLDLLAVKGAQEFSNTTIQKHQLFGAQLSL